MEEFQPAELAVFLDDLHRRPDGKTSLMLRCARESGCTKEFAVRYNPFQYEADARAIADTLPMVHSILAVLLPKAQFSACVYQLKKSTNEPEIQYDRTLILKQVGLHQGFQGLPDDPELAPDGLIGPAAKVSLERALTLMAATALYRTLGCRVRSLYFMERDWDHAYLLTPMCTPLNGPISIAPPE